MAKTRDKDILGRVRKVRGSEGGRESFAEFKQKYDSYLRSKGNRPRSANAPSRPVTTTIPTYKR